MRVIVDTSVLIAGIRSPGGASAEILRRVLRGEFVMLASVPLFLEYEAVALRVDHLSASGASMVDVRNLLDALASCVTPVEVRFSWRPQLRDANDEMVLEAAINGGADAVATFNVRDIEAAAARFGISVLLPAALIRRLKHGHD